MVDVKIKKLVASAVIPRYAKDGDAGLDLVATSVTKEINDAGDFVFAYGTGLAFEIPSGYVGLLFPRSSISKTNLSLTNSVGVLDSGYRGEVVFKFRSVKGGDAPSYKQGERIGQIIVIPYPQVNFIESDNLSNTERGSGGYGSTGK